MNPAYGEDAGRYTAGDRGVHSASDASRRIAAIESQLQRLQSSLQFCEYYRSDLASMRSLLAPAMQGGPTFQRHLRSVKQTASPSYSEEEYQFTHDVMESLALRRDLSQPENPPFGIWWTYTVEETLLWPILEFDGAVNQILDILLDSSDDEDNISKGYSDHSTRISQPTTSGSQNHPGLDDGNLVPELIEDFLRNVHIRSPILDPTELRTIANDLVENGPGWNGETCLVVRITSLTVRRVSRRSRLIGPSGYAYAVSYMCIGSNF